MQAATTRCARPDAPAAVPTWGRRQRRQHQQLQRRLCARAAGAPPDIDARVYTDASAQPAHFVGTVQPALIPGKGRGLLAARALVPGQLLLVAPPLALVEGGLGEIPEHDELQEVIAASGALFSPWQAAWLKALATTTGSSSDGAAARGAAAGGAHAGALKQLPSLLPPAGEGAWCGQSSPDHHQQQQQQAAGPQAPRVPFQALGMDEERLWAAIVLNCYGEGFQDLPASLCAAAPVSSQLGLWGAFSLLNHSCCPNAVSYTLRDCMVVRATAAVAVGEELTINYLGRSSLAPLSQRQQELEASYGFSCSCTRCQTEASWGGLLTASGRPLSHVLEQVDADVRGVYEPQLAGLLQQEQRGQQEQPQQGGVQQQLAQLAAAMERQWRDIASAFAQRGGTSSVMRQEEAWALASAFDLLGLLHDARQAAGQPDAAALDALLRVCECACAGSDLHLFQALRRTSIAQSRGAATSTGAHTARAAADDPGGMAALTAALRVRYGQQVVADEQLLRRMVAATAEAASLVAF